MNLIKDEWTKKDIADFEDYLKTKSKGKDKAIWQQRIVNTNLPCLAVPAQEVQNLAKEICKGNFKGFLSYNLWNFYEETAINGFLICKISNFEEQKQHLLSLSAKADNWSTIDSLKFKFTKQNRKMYMDFAKEILHSRHTFTRRLALIIMLKLAGEKDFTNDILSCADTFFNETEYYVNMANAWLLCEMFIKHRNETYAFLQNHHLNEFTLRKMVSKCRDSFRVSDQDKIMLKNLIVRV